MHVNYIQDRNIIISYDKNNFTGPEFVLNGDRMNFFFWGGEVFSELGAIKSHI